MSRIFLRVRSSERPYVHVYLSSRMALGKLMKAYADFFQLNLSDLMFRSRGINIHARDTPERLELCDRYIIDVHWNPTRRHWNRNRNNSRHRESNQSAFNSQGHNI
ncbi:hypothetical protein KR009_008286 [Drosophila setifemur]|nr:hypothetical protein KR009_008286 [Drosophila setifemur]